MDPDGVALHGLCAANAWFSDAPIAEGVIASYLSVKEFQFIGFSDDPDPHSFHLSSFIPLNAWHLPEADSQTTVVALSTTP